MSAAHNGPLDSATERVTDASRILMVLERTHTARALLSVSTPFAKSQHTSAILEILSDQRLMVLDELNPLIGENKIQAGTEFQIRTSLKGVEISFKCVVLSVGHKDKLAFYRLQLPSLILYKQRRNSFRISMSSAHNNAVVIHPPGQNKAEGRLLDISLGGIGAHLTNTITLTKGDMVSGCHILLPKLDHEIVSDLEVCFIKVNEKEKSLRLGGRLHNLSKDQENKISRLLLQLQREQLRKTP